MDGIERNEARRRMQQTARGEEGDSREDGEVGLPCREQSRVSQRGRGRECWKGLGVRGAD
jgi:hypothetical protein